ncbi:MAG: formyl transferase [Desulfovibrionaceae bacterium]
MRILLFGKADLHGNMAMNELVRRLQPGHELRIILSDYVVDCEREARYSDWLVALERDFALDVFFPALDTIALRTGPGQTPLNRTYKELADATGVPISLEGNPNEPEVLERVRAFAPDVALSCRHDYIFKPEIISVPPCGFYNLHPGALPEFRGLSAPFWTMLEGRAEAACTFYHIDPGIDTGPVVRLAEVPIDYSRSLIWNQSRVYRAGVEAFLECLDGFARGPLPQQTQEQGRKRYFSAPGEADFAAFLARGNEVVLTADYLELLGTYLPGGESDPLIGELASRLPDPASFGLE